MTDALSPQQLSQEGKAAYQRGDYQASAKAYQASAQGFERTGDLLAAAEERNNLSVVLNRAGDAQGALKAVEGTPAVFAAAGDLRRQGMALGNWAAALEALKRHPEAIQAYEQAAEAFRQCGEDELRAHVFKSLSVLRLRSGRVLEALLLMHTALDSLRKPTLSQRLLKHLLGMLRKSLPR